jgi:1-acyl-sn-glycerol-3-phosphate acyltransferase
VRRGRLGFWYRLAVCLIKPAMLVLTRRDWRGQQHIPPAGGVIIAANHVSYADPFTFAHYVYDAGRPPCFPAKIELFRLRWPLGRIVRGAGQIPVYRNSANAADALRDAVAAIRRGEAVVIYPEGTVTRDPQLWPMVARTGVARLAMATGALVVPVAQWGPQRMYSRAHGLHLSPAAAVFDPRIAADRGPDQRRSA